MPNYELTKEEQSILQSAQNELEELRKQISENSASSVVLTQLSDKIVMLDSLVRDVAKKSANDEPENLYDRSKKPPTALEQAQDVLRQYQITRGNLLQEQQKREKQHQTAEVKNQTPAVEPHTKTAKHSAASNQAAMRMVHQQHNPKMLRKTTLNNKERSYLKQLLLRMKFYMQRINQYQRMGHPIGSKLKEATNNLIKRMEHYAKAKNMSGLTSYANTLQKTLNKALESNLQRKSQYEPPAKRPRIS